MTQGNAAAGRTRLMVGIDPGLTVTGYGLIALEGNRLRHVEHGVWRRGPGVDGGQRLAELGDRLEAYLARHRPSAVAIEQAFLGKNVQSTLRLGEARGALIVACVRQGLVPIEFPAATVKKAITGNGRAAKEQVQYMVAKLLALPRQPEPADAADALAVAMTLALDWRFSPANRAELRERGS